MNATNPKNVYINSFDSNPATALPGNTSLKWLFKNGTADFKINDRIWFYTTDYVNSKSDILLHGNGGPLTFPAMSFCIESVDQDNTGRLERVYRKIDSAKQYCEELIRFCTNQYGPDYRFIAAGVAYTYGIALYQDKELYTCPNWRIKKSELKDFWVSRERTGTYTVSCQNMERLPTTFKFVRGKEALEWKNDSGKTYEVFNMKDKTDIAYWVNYYFADLLLSDMDKYVGGPYCAGE